MVIFSLWWFEIYFVIIREQVIQQLSFVDSTVRALKTQSLVIERSKDYKYPQYTLIWCESIWINPGWTKVDEDMPR